MYIGGGAVVLILIIVLVVLVTSAVTILAEPCARKPIDFSVQGRM
jgi:hypothetical protein